MMNKKLKKLCLFLELLQDLGVSLEPQLQNLSVQEPAKRKGGVILSSAAELVDKLKNEAKVI